MNSHAMDRPIVQPWWSKKALWRSATALAAVAAMAIWASTLSGKRTLRIPMTRVMVAEVSNSTFHDFVPLRGLVVPRDVIYLDVQEGGRVERVLVRAGDEVFEGQELVEFTNTNLQLEVIRGEVSLIEQINGLRNTEMSLQESHVAAEQRLEDVNYHLLTLGRQADRQNFYFAKGVTTAEDRDKVLDELAYYRKLKPAIAEQNEQQNAFRLRRIPELHATIKKLDEDLAITRSKLQNLMVRAPKAGRLTDLGDIQIGQNMLRGQHLAVITLDTGFRVSAEVDEFYLSRVKAGQKATLETPGGQKVLTVKRTYPQVKEGRFKVDLDFEGAAPLGLLAGQALQGKLQLGDDHRAIIIPSGAFLDVTGGDWIFVLEADGKSADHRRIRVGRRNAEQLEVLDGLHPGDRVIVSDYRGLVNMDRISLIQ
jgi:HlyD family secretion protein